MHEELKEYLLSFGFSKNDIEIILERTNMRDVNLIKAKIKAYKDLLKLGDNEIRKMIASFPALLCYDTNNDSETSVKGKIKAYKELLKLSDSEIRKTIIKNPSLLGLDTNSDSENSIKGKIKRIQQILPFETLRKIAIERPQIFCAPAQQFKIRYMLSSILDNTQKFFYRNGFMTNEKKSLGKVMLPQIHKQRQHQNKLYLYK